MNFDFFSPNKSQIEYSLQLMSHCLCRLNYMSLLLFLAVTLLSNLWSNKFSFSMVDCQTYPRCTDFYELNTRVYSYSCQNSLFGSTQMSILYKPNYQIGDKARCKTLYKLNITFIFPSNHFPSH